MSNVGKRIGVFLGVLALAIAVGSLALGVGGQSAPAVNDANTSSFNTDDAVASVPNESGEISMSEDAEGKVVVIDTTYSASATPENVAPIANTLTENGATVRYSSGGSGYGFGLNSTLSEADAYIIFGAQQPFSGSDAAGLQAFTEAGGRVILMNEPQRQAPQGLFGSSSSFGAAPDPLLPLTNEYGLSYDNGYLYNMQDNSNNYRDIYATPSGDSTLTDGVDQVVFHEAVAINGGETALTATEGTKQSSSRRAETYNLMTRTGNLVVFGDSSFVNEEWVYRADNEVLVGNLLDYLVSGEKSPEDAPGSGGFGGGGGGGGGFGEDGGYTEDDGGSSGGFSTNDTATPSP